MIQINRLKNLPVHPSKKYNRRSLSRIKQIVIHHFAGTISIEEAAKLHVSKGWPGIGYWAVIDFDASLNIVNDLDVRSYNVRSKNTASIGLAVRGNYEKHLPAQRMIYTMDKTIEHLRAILGWKVPVMCHSDLVTTKCPGSKLRSYVNTVYGQD